MNRIFVMSVLICALCAFPAPAQDRETRTIAATFADTLAKLGKRNVAVVDFTDLEGNATELGRYLAEQMSVALALTDRGIGVIDRTHLKAIIQENKLNASGLIDPATARKLGQIAGVEVLVTGTLTPFGDSVQLALKALDANTAKIVAASTTEVARTKAIDDLLARGLATGSSQDSGQRSPNSAGTPRTNNASDAPTAPSLVKEVEEIAFGVNYCKSAGDSVTCVLQITNKGRDRDVTIGGAKTRIIDQSGREYLVTGVQLGSKVCRGCDADNALVTDVPMIAAATFANVSSVSSISLLEIWYWAKNGRGWSTVQFRNIPISSSRK